MRSPLPNRRSRRRAARGFLLLEVVLALGIFGIAATGFAVALQRTADLAALTQRELTTTRLLQSALAEAMSYPVLEEGTTSIAIDEMAEHGMEIVTTVELLPEMENEDGQLLQEMYRIEVVAHWYENGVPQEQSAETWRYSRLYQP
ncbi:type II secretion system GspH family protein [Luteolibacter flavescens]|uniref:Type II secretion system GspH family protein n=1 Tax=Luteolibacter flavescens TaxID=1859460 RepID=A0ABT3FT86_9BACT|nr:type II secretion system protein [Luteolibacter flavescens]MCW1886461.1 type II secretion system GspH family protein [Luteolibacter flavescens]